MIRGASAGAFVLGVACLPTPANLGRELDSGSGGGTGSAATSAPNDSGSGSAGGSSAGVDCGADRTPPALAEITPADGTLGVDPAAQVRARLVDPCGIDEATVALEANGAPLDLQLNGGDATDVEARWLPVSPGLGLDTVVDLRVLARDIAGNELDATVRYRNWDELQAFGDLRGIDSTQPDIAQPDAEGYLVRDDGADRRVVGLTPVPAEPAGTVAVAVDLRVCTNMPPAADTTVVCYPLNAAFTDAEVTYNDRSAGVGWSAPGAEAVPADRSSTAMTAIDFAMAGVAYDVIAADVTAQVQAWLDGTPNVGFVCLGDANGTTVLSAGSNCPPHLLGFIGRPLP